MIYSLGNLKVRKHGRVWIAPSAVVTGDVILKNNVNIWYGAVLRGDIETITIDEGTNVQDNSVLHTDKDCPLIIGKGITVGHSVILHGCIIEDDALIGMGATILNGAHIGKNSIIGANSLITEGKKIPERSLVMGSPGKVIRQVTDKEIQDIKDNAMRYVQNSLRYETQATEQKD
jgi:carbonic anhydrase/acetyltransferase-like protein (isoleucine patch superfamily)